MSTFLVPAIRICLPRCHRSSSEPSLGLTSGLPLLDSGGVAFPEARVSIGVVQPGSLHACGAATLGALDNRCCLVFISGASARLWFHMGAELRYVSSSGTTKGLLYGIEIRWYIETSRLVILGRAVVVCDIRLHWPSGLMLAQSCASRSLYKLPLRLTRICCKVMRLCRWQYRGAAGAADFVGVRRSGAPASHNITLLFLFDQTPPKVRPRKRPARTISRD